MHLSHFILVCFVVVAVSARSHIVRETEPEPQCEYEGERYNAGETIPKSDPCTTCFCTDTGLPMCMSSLCARPLCGPDSELIPGPPGSCCQEKCSSYCVVNGRRYEPNEDIPTGDPCASCHCAERFGKLCSHKLCGWPRCPNNERPVMHPGVCCPSCPEESNNYDDFDLPSTCTIGDIILSEGDDVPSSDPCERCRCMGHRGVQCERPRCGWPHCPNGDRPISAPGVCCPFCPDGSSPSGPGDAPGGSPGGIPSRPPLPDTNNEE